MGNPLRIAFVCPRYAEGPTVGGAETLLKNLAVHAAAAGHRVHFLTTCARDHFSWANVVPPGTHRREGMDVTFFPVDEDRDLETFLTVQDRISRRRSVTRAEETAWLQNNVNSRALQDYLRAHADRFDRLIMGPYLFGLIFHAARIEPNKTLLVPCLHDESFAYLETIGEMFRSVRGCIFNSDPERELARRLYGIPDARARVVGMGIDSFNADPAAFARQHGIDQPYVVYCGRREPLKGTPLLVDYVAAFRRRTGRDVKLVLTGSGRVDVPPELSAHVIDAGFVSEADKRNAMAGATAFCHPSVNESFGIVLLESWLAGTPALVHAGSDVLTDQCRRSGAGFWFRIYPEFEAELLVLLNRTNLRAAMGMKGREYVHRTYSWNAVDRRLEAALQQL